MPILLVSCLKTQPDIPYINDEQLVRQINCSFDQIFPDHFKVLHHAVLEFGEKHYVLNGYILINREHEQFSINVQNDLGGSIFEIESVKNKMPKISMPFEIFKEAWIKKSVIKDLNELYLSCPFPSPDLLLDNGSYRLIQRHGDGMEEERIFRKISGGNKYILISYTKSNNGKTIYRIGYKYNKTTVDQYPDMIFISDKKMHYSLKINALYYTNNKQ